MKYARILGIVVSATLVLASSAVLADREQDLANAEKAVKEFLKADPDLQSFFDKSFGYAVFNSVGKGGIGVGGAFGTGVVYRQGVPIGKTSLNQVTVGFQFGGQAFRELIFFQDEKALQSFISQNFELSVQASAVAVTAGAAAKTNFDNGMAIFTMAKGGLMYEATVGGQGFGFEAYGGGKKEKKEDG
jgi:lipid-binding SYLF domain-containing protein